MQVTILGCGSSAGVPSLSRGYGLCDPFNPKNHRTRSAALIKTNDKQTILIDSGPEIREQLLAVGTPQVDAVIYTHAHFDHMGGANDIYIWSRYGKKKMGLYITADDLRRLKSYYLPHAAHNADLENAFDIHLIKPYETFQIGETTIFPIRQYHGDVETLGFRLGDLAYSTDVREMDPEGFEALCGVKTWVLSVVNTKESDKHAPLHVVLEWIERIRPQKTYLTHLSHKLDYDTLCAELPKNIRPAYDGLRFRA